MSDDPTAIGVGLAATLETIRAAALAGDGDHPSVLVRIADCDRCHGSEWIRTALTDATGDLEACPACKRRRLRGRSVDEVVARMRSMSALLDEDGEVEVDPIGRLARTFGQLERIPQQDYVRRAIGRWMREMDERPHLVLVGPVGTGKTALAIAGAIEAARRVGLEPVVWPVASGMQHLADHVTDGVGADKLRQLKKADIEVVDDLGTEMQGAMAANRLYQLFDSRYVAGRPIVATSNRPLRDLAPRLQRILDADQCRVVVVTGDNVRAVGASRMAAPDDAPYTSPKAGIDAYHALPGVQACPRCHNHPCVCHEEDNR